MLSAEQFGQRTRLGARHPPIDVGQDVTQQPGSAVDKSGIQLNQARTGGELFPGVGGVHDSADTNDRQSAAQCAG